MTFNKKNQQGIALLSAVLIIMIFAIMGMMNAQKAKESEKMAGAAVRYDTVFEAAERTLRDAGDYLLRIDGVPYADDGSKGRSKVANFDVSGLANATTLVNLVTDPDSAIVWKRETLEREVCGAGNCSAGVDFVPRLDGVLWNDLAIQSDFSGTCTGNDDIACNNYLQDIRAYTFIEQLRTNSRSGAGELSHTGMKGTTGLTGVGSETYYLITVKASGFPPGTTNTGKSDPLNARENIILQGVFARL